MGFVSRAAKTVKREAGYLVGANGIYAWFRNVRVSLQGRFRKCPVCGEGKMMPFTEPVNNVDRDFFGCSRCEHFEVADLANEKDVVVAESLGRLRDLAGQRIGQLKPKEVLELRNRFKWNSRLFYLFSVVLLSAGWYLYFVSDSAWYLLNSTGLSMLVFSHGMRSSYRYWQVCNNAFYQPGAFRRWLGLGQWLV